VVEVDASVRDRIGDADTREARRRCGIEKIAADRNRAGDQ
jgi:hypothetical protein